MHKARNEKQIADPDRLLVQVRQWGLFSKLYKTFLDFLIMGDRKKLLIVDDDLHVLKACTGAFYRYDARIAIGAEEAIGYLVGGYRPNFILVDNDMRNRDDGVRFVNALYVGSLGAFSGDSRVALWSARMCRDIRNKVKEFPCVKCFTKPVSNIGEIATHFEDR